MSNEMWGEAAVLDAILAVSLAVNCCLMAYNWRLMRYLRELHALLFEVCVSTLELRRNGWPVWDIWEAGQEARRAAFERAKRQ